MENITNANCTIPTPSFVSRAENEALLSKLGKGSSTTVTWEGMPIRVTVTMKGKVAFYEPDVLKLFELNEANFPPEVRAEYRKEWADIAYDPDEDLLVYEGALYLYHFMSPTPMAKKFVRWTCNEVLPMVRVLSTASVDGADGDITLTTLLNELRMSTELTESRLEQLGRRQNYIVEGEQPNLSELTSNISELFDATVEHNRQRNEELIDRLNAIDKKLTDNDDKLEDAVKVFHNAQTPLSDAGAAAVSKSKKPRKPKPYTEEQSDQYRILHHQLSCATGGDKKGVSGAFANRYSSEFWYVNKHITTGSVLDKIGNTIAKGLETTGGIEEFLDICEEVLRFNGLCAMTLEKWEHARRLSDEEFQEWLDGELVGNNLTICDVKDIVLK